MPEDEPKVVCQTPTPGKQATRIARWKYDLVRRIILRVVPRNLDGVEFRELSGLVADALSQDDRQRLGSVPWYTTVVKLDMEVRGEIERIADSRPQLLRRVR